MKNFFHKPFSQPLNRKSSENKCYCQIKVKSSVASLWTFIVVFITILLSLKKLAYKTAETVQSLLNITEFISRFN